jgi:transcription-repair coupling factor (superfamily II helicase)
VTIALPLASYLPATYVADERLRLRCYQDLAGCATESELDARAKGLVDRFGPMPAPADGLIHSLRARLLAAAAGALSVETEPDGVLIRLPLDHGLDLRSVVAQVRSALTATPTQLHLRRSGAWRDQLLAVLRELGRLQRIRQRAPAAVG